MIQTSIVFLTLISGIPGIFSFVHLDTFRPSQVSFTNQNPFYNGLPFHQYKTPNSKNVCTRSMSSSITSTASENVIESDNEVEKSKYIGDVVLLLPSEDADALPSKFGSLSPIPNPSIQDAVTHLAKKIQYFSDDTVKVHIRSLPSTTMVDAFDDILIQANALIAFQINTPMDTSNLAKIFKKRRELPETEKKFMCQFALDSGPKSNFASIVGPFDEVNVQSLEATIGTSVTPWTTYASAKRMNEQMKQLFSRWTSDDFTIALMLFFNQFNTNRSNAQQPSSIPWVEHSIDATWEKGPIQNAQEFYSMISKCGSCITKCLADPNCKACIDALNEVDTRDQVASYRTVVSYESELLREFSFCILQKNNIFGCKAAIPKLPVVTPMKRWRNKEMTKDDAKGILIGHLDDEEALEGGGGTEVSWKVACGANVAYDQFPSQNQIFYSSVNGRDLWYDPVFRVETIDGRNVWAKRHYKVRHGKVPGTFYFSVLDNGVTSNEYWNIVGAADDLSWIVFHYAGAAGAVGQRYLGGLLCTKDGSLPPEKDREQIWQLFQSCGIEPWELFVVDNDLQSPGALEAGPAPLDFYRKDVLQAKAEKKQEIKT